MTDTKHPSGPQKPAANDHKNDHSKQQQQQTEHRNAAEKEKQRMPNEGGKPQQK